MKLGSCFAAAVVEAGGYSSVWTPSLGTSICHGSSPRKRQKDKKFQHLIFIDGLMYRGIKYFLFFHFSSINNITNSFIHATFTEII